MGSEMCIRDRIAPESATYLSVPALVAALVALLVPWPFIHFTWFTVQWIYVMQLLVFLALLANITYVQYFQAADVRARAGNSRVIFEEYSRQRGPILLGSTAIASSNCRQASRQSRRRLTCPSPAWRTRRGIFTRCSSTLRSRIPDRAPASTSGSCTASAAAIPAGTPSRWVTTYRSPHSGRRFNSSIRGYSG